MHVHPRRSYVHLQSISCPVCGSTFRPRSQRSKFCGRDCQYAAKRRVLSEPILRQVCCACKVDKDISEFYASRSTVTGLQYQCKDCFRARERSRHEIEYPCEVCGKVIRRLLQSPSVEANKIKRCHRCAIRHVIEANGGVTLNYNGTDNFAGKTFSTWVASAKKRGHFWALTRRQLEEKYQEQKGICALSGIRMEPKTASPYRPSLDRLDSMVGYVVGNFQFVCSVVNVMKNRLPDPEFVRLCRLIATHRTDL